MVCYEPDGDDDCYKEDCEDFEPSYVIRRLMLAPKQEGDSQRHQLLHTRCTIGGRVFDLIVIVEGARISLANKLSNSYSCL